MKLFDLDSPFINFLGKLADMMLLTFLTMLCCIPVFTVGAAFTALHYVILRMVRNEDGYIAKSYFKAFRENFKQSTIIWLLFLVVIAFLGVDYYLILETQIELHLVVKVLLLFLGVVVYFTWIYVWPMQAKFGNTVRRTICNAFAASVVLFPKTIVMAFLYASPLLAWWYITPIVPGIIPILFVFWASLPAYLSAVLYNKFFRAMEKKILGQDENEDGEGENAENLDVLDTADSAENTGTTDIGQNV